MIVVTFLAFTSAELSALIRASSEEDRNDLALCGCFSAVLFLYPAFPVFLTFLSFSGCTVLFVFEIFFRNAVGAADTVKRLSRLIARRGSLLRGIDATPSIDKSRLSLLVFSRIFVCSQLMHFRASSCPLFLRAFSAAEKYGGAVFTAADTASSSPLGALGSPSAVGVFLSIN